MIMIPHERKFAYSILFVAIFMAVPYAHTQSVVIYTEYGGAVRGEAELKYIGQKNKWLISTSSL